MVARSCSLRLLLFAAFVATVLPSVNAASNDWDVAVYDQILASTPQSEPLVKVGDMRFTRAFIQAWRNALAQSKQSGISPESSFATSGTTVALWTSGTIPYSFDSTVTGSPNSARYQQAFLDAANEWAAFANVTFIPRTSQADYVTLVAESSGANFADLGMIGGQQFIHIGTSNFNHGTLCHEIGHTLGLVHEHQRSDRDSYVTIQTANIQSGAEGNFTLLPGSLNRGAYDFYSVMHYSRALFSSNGQDTIVPLPAYSQYLDIMGNVFDRVLSTLDRAGLALTYGAGPLVSGTVTNTKDSGPGSLRTALYYSIDHPNTTVSFRIPNTDPNFSGGVLSIKPTDTLPTPGVGTVVDATTQTAFTGNTNASGPEVLVSGTLTQVPDVYGDGIALTDSNCTVKGLVIGGFKGAGVRITGTTAKNETVAGCYLGTDAGGAAAFPNGFCGVQIDGGASGCLIGGTSAGNVISGNTYQGIVIRDAGTTNNSIQGNLVGLVAAGTSALPNMSEGIAIYGGAKANVIGGTVAGSGNVISGNATYGVLISGTGVDNNLVQGNVIGLNSARTAAVPNVWSGVTLSSGANGTLIGGTTSSARNIISGNGNYGISIYGPGSAPNYIQGNFIGVNAVGTAAIGNAFSGIVIAGGAQNIVIGGTSSGAGNLISGNANSGIQISGSTTSNNSVQGNYIGTNATGTGPVANAGAGIAIFSSAPNNTIGGTAPGARNLISGNGYSGVTIQDAGSTGNFVQSNYIGLGADGITALGNNGDGVAIYGGAQSNTVGGSIGSRNFIANNLWSGVSFSGSSTNLNTVQCNSIGLTITGGAAGNSYAGVLVFGGAQNNVIGGTTPGASNLIANNLRGVEVDDLGSTGNSARANSIFNNTQYGIALFSSGNNSQSHPTLTSGTLGLTTNVQGTLASAASQTFQIDFYGSPSGSQGKTYLGSASATANGSGNASFNVSLAPIVPIGNVITATATDPSGNTSDFSNSVTVTTDSAAGDGIPNVWRQTYFGSLLVTPGVTDAGSDFDHDGKTNLQEFYAGTDPTKSTSLPRISAITRLGSDIRITLQTMLGKVYRVEKADDLLTHFWVPLADQVVSTGTTVQITDPGATSLTKRFYRAVVEP